MATKPKIVTIDDDLLLLEMCRDILEASDFDCVPVSDSTAAMGTIHAVQPDLVMTDLQMPKVTGMDILMMIKEEYPDLPVIILTGHGTIESAVQAVQLGARDYVPKPFKPDELCHRIRQALENSRLTKENEDLRRQLAESRATGDLVGSSRAMEKVFSTLGRAAPTDANVMIMGESGTGKEMIARAIHRQSRRHDCPFIPVDCVSLPDQLIESELFGHVKGSFTGAIDDKEGLFEAANGGTLFLDEITEMNIELQSKLLRVLQERKFRRVGGRELHDLNVRLIAATNRDPQEAITERRLRLDLYYRLNVIPVELPPLRERGEDILLLLNHFLHRYCNANDLPLKTFSRDALEILLHYSWPGNVRELQNLVERLVILAAGDQITTHDLPQNLVSTETDTPKQPFSVPDFTAFDAQYNGFDEHLFELPFKSAKRVLCEKFERVYLEELLDQHKGNISGAARTAGIDRKTIHRLVKSYQLEVKK